AARGAADDAGAPGFLRAVQRIAVPHGSWQYTDPGRIIAERIGAAGARTALVATGIPQQTLLNDAHAAIRDGSLDVALIVGGVAVSSRRLPGATRRGVPPRTQRGEPSDRLPVQQVALRADERRSSGGALGVQPRRGGTVRRRPRSDGVPARRARVELLASGADATRPASVAGNGGARPGRRSAPRTPAVGHRARRALQLLPRRR